MENNTVRVRAYNKVWKLDNRIYAIQNLVLPVPVSTREVGYCLAAMGVMFLLQAIIPIVQYVPSVIRFLVIPIAVTQFLLKKKLDGKPPLKYFAAWINYIFTREEYIERFQSHTGKKNEKIKIDWFCSQGYSTTRDEITDAVEAQIPPLPEGIEIEPTQAAPPAAADREPNAAAVLKELDAEEDRTVITATRASKVKAPNSLKSSLKVKSPKENKEVYTKPKPRKEKQEQSMEKTMATVLLGVILAIFAAVMAISALK